MIQHYCSAFEHETDYVYQWTLIEGSQGCSTAHSTAEKICDFGIFMNSFFCRAPNNAYNMIR